jgi:hypothetical protein
MKVYEVECGATITLTAEDMQKAALHGAAAIKDNLHLIYVRAVHERNFEPALGAEKKLPLAQEPLPGSLLSVLALP